MIEKILRKNSIEKRKKIVSKEISKLISIKKDWKDSFKKKPKTEYQKTFKLIEAVVLIKLIEEIKVLRKIRVHLTKMLVNKSKHVK